MSEKKHFCDILTTGHAALQPRAMADADWIPRTGAGSDPIIKDCVCLNEYPPAVSGKMAEQGPQDAEKIYQDSAQ